MWLAYGSIVILDVAELLLMSGSSTNDWILTKNAITAKTKRW